MKKDQGRIVKQCLANDEPVFALRGQDKCAVPALKRYYLTCGSAGCSQEFLNEIMDIIEEFSIFQSIEETKIPD